MTFSVGEIAILHATPIECDEPQLIAYLGQEVEVTDPLGPHGGWFEEYGIRAKDGREMWVRPSALRKRPPPRREDVGEWELCPWQPKQVTNTGNGK